MTPYEEFIELGSLGLEGYVWWKRQVRIIANRYNFPPPGDHRSWTDDASADWLNDAFEHRGKLFMAKIVALASDNESYGRVVRKSIKNEFIDGAKATTEGKLRNRLRTILAKQPGLRDATPLFAGKPAWTLDALGDAIWVGDWNKLLRLPGYSRERIEYLNPAGPTSAENKRKLVDAVRVLIEGARGAVPDQVIARVLVRLFDLDDLPPYLLGDEQVVTTDDALDLVAHVVDAQNDRDEHTVEWFKLRDEADALLSELSEDEKQVLSALDADELGAVSSAFQTVAQRLGTSREAMLIAINKCARLDFGE